jgi:hypothetical protein
MTQVILYTSEDRELVVKETLTAAADGNLSAIPTGSQNPARWRPCHG